MNPYTTPTAAPNQFSAVDCASKQKLWKRVWWVALIVFFIPVALGVLSVVNIYSLSFATVGNSGIGDPTIMAAIIGEMIIGFMVFLIFALPGLILLILSTIRLRFWRKMG
jgi:hypothetical protein